MFRASMNWPLPVMPLAQSPGVIGVAEDAPAAEQPAGIADIVIDTDVALAVVTFEVLRPVEVVHNSRDRGLWEVFEVIGAD